MNIEDAKKILLANMETLTTETKEAIKIILLELDTAEKKISQMIKNSESLSLSLENLPNEIWRDVVGYEGRYKVSNKGRVKSLYWKKEKILKPSFTKRGYYALGLSKNGISRKIDVLMFIFWLQRPLSQILKTIPLFIIKMPIL